MDNHQYIPAWGTDSMTNEDLVLVFRAPRELLFVSENRHSLPLLTPAELAGLPGRAYRIGSWEGRRLFVFAAEDAASSPSNSQWDNPRPLLGFLSVQAFSAFSRASMIASWHRDHRFCNRCGSPVDADAVEPAMVCTACEHRSYPRLSPAVIVLVSDGDRILLGNNRNFPSDLYSCLAGYVDPGEGLEEAAIREVAEESSVAVTDLRYIASQPWAFPHSLMVGFFATGSGTPVPDGVEISDVAWFAKDNLPNIPPPGTIARLLIDRWLASRP